MVKLAKWASVLIVILLVLAACGAGGSSPAKRTGENTIPTPSSKLIGSFIWQTDGTCGYRMLRPEGWEASQVECRLYKSQVGQNQADRLVLQAHNYQVMAQQMSSGILVQYELFKKNSTLNGWSQAIEQSWKSDGTQFTLLDMLPQAKVYSIVPPGSPDVQIVAFEIDENQPLGLGLTASGAYADLERLNGDGILNDFKAMLESLQALAYDPQNIVPPLNSQ